MTPVLRRWTIVTWNLRGSGDPPLRAVADAVREIEPDVLVLQEVRRHQARRLARLLGWEVCWHRKHHPYSPFVWWTTEGMALATPHRLTETASTSLTPGATTWNYRHRIAVQGLVTRPDASAYRVLDIHLASDDDGAHDRLDQAQRALAWIADAGPAPIVIAGDFNDHADVEVVTALCGQSRRDAWSVAMERSPGDGSTCPTDVPTKRLDHVLVPADAAVVRAHVPAGGAPWTTISDHLPLVVTFDAEWVEGDWPQIRSQ
jgi:endonuclease/exonuclease/phosphatase family metal-dependent hydrolase